MRLEEKGRVLPPPKLSGPSARVLAAVREWSGVISATHWLLDDRTQVDGADFYVGELELGHIHLGHAVHLALQGKLRAAVLKAGLAEPSPWTARTWVEFQMRSVADAEHGEWLLRLGYDALIGVATEALVERVQQRAKARAAA
jgi:hypothetical protein